MVAKRLIGAFLAVLLVSLLYFQPLNIDNLQLDHGTVQSQFNRFSDKSVVDKRGHQGSNAVKSNNTEIIRHHVVAGPSSGKTENLSVNTNRIQFFGRVVDEYNQPIENVLISEDSYSYNTRSDINGRYHLIFELPKHKSALLNFLHTGYKADRVDISNVELNIEPVVELNVTLVESSESVKLDGWISDENGESLSGQKIRIASWGYQGKDSIYYTVISDEKGEFVFEAVKPDIEYELEVYAAPEYAPFTIENLMVTRTPERLNISLKRLKYIQISGMFVDIEGSPVPNFEIDIINLSTEAHARKIVSDSSGFFSLKNFPAGKMKFLGRAPEYFVLTGITLSANEYKSLILTIERGGHHLSGWVSDQNGVAVDRAMVTLDAEITNEGVQLISIRSAVTDSTGKFDFGQLGDVEHMITIFAKGFDKKEQSHRFQSNSSEVHIVLSRQ